MKPSSLSLLLCVATVFILNFPNPTYSVTIDDFEVGDFSFVTASSGAGPSVHQSLDSAHVISGHRDVFTIGHDGAGSQTSLATGAGNDGVIIAANSTGTIYWNEFRYAGPVLGSFNLNADLLSEGHNTISLQISDVFVPLPATITVEVLTNQDEPNRAFVSIVRPITSNGVMHFSYASFLQLNGAIDFSDVDTILLELRLQTASRLKITDIRTTFVPEPGAIVLLAFGSFVLILRPRFSE
jgi:hypothetical protein